MSALQEAANLVLLALVVWREASNQIYLAKLAVAYSILERVKHGGWWGYDLPSVIARPWQYTSMTGMSAAGHGDPNLIRWPRAEDASWADSLTAANAAIHGTEDNPAPTADSYYSNPIANVPDWAKPERFLIQIGSLRFYRVGVNGK